VSTTTPGRDSTGSRPIANISSGPGVMVTVSRPFVCAIIDGPRPCFLTSSTPLRGPGSMRYASLGTSVGHIFPAVGVRACRRGGALLFT
jgi:hypothetical protein